MGLHKNISFSCNHVAHSLQYANETIRTTVSGLDTTDIGRIARQSDNDTFWLLTDIAPVTWIQLGVSTVGSINDIGDVDTTSGLDVGDHLQWDGLNWIPVDPGIDSDINAKVSANDTTTGYLNGKLVAGTNIVLTEINDGGDETLSISASGILITDSAPVNVTKDTAIIGIATDAARADHKHDINTSSGLEITDSTNAEGTSTSLSRSDHLHAHGDRGGGSLHIVATSGINGFMSATDKLKLDNMATNGSGDDWISGLAITAQPSPDQTVDYTSGTYLINGVEYAVSPDGTYDLQNGYGSVDHYAALSGGERALVSIYVDADQVIKSVAGASTSGTDPELPTFPTDYVCVAIVLIRKNSGGSPHNITPANISDCRYRVKPKKDELVKTSSVDTTSGFLIDKLSNNGNVHFTKENPDLNETLKADVQFGTTSGVACVGDDSRLTDDRTASGLRTATTVVSISSATAPVSGQVLTANSGTLATWQTPTTSSGVSIPQFDFDADQLLSPNNSDWTVNANAPLSADSNNAGLSCRLFDDTSEEGIGFQIPIPSGVTNMKIKLKSRAGTAPAGSRTVGLKLYNRGLPDNTSVESWSAGNTLSDIDIPANEYFQYDEQTITLSTLGVTAGELTQFELTRVNPSAGTELTGDWSLLHLGVEFS